MRCDKDGGSCSDITGANNKAGYLLKLVDVGNTIRFKVQAKNQDGSTFASSVPTAVIAPAVAPPPPPATTGCPTGTGSVQVADVKPPARLLIDSQHSSPSVVHAGSQQIVLRYHVSACGGRSVQGALVYATPTPYNQVSIPGEQTTGADGFAELRFQHWPASPSATSSSCSRSSPGHASQATTCSEASPHAACSPSRSASRANSTDSHAAGRQSPGPRRGPQETPRRRDRP